MSRRLPWFAPALLVAVLAACTQRLTTPGDCPTLCPGGEVQVFDEVLLPIEGQDSAFVGYAPPGNGPALLLSNGIAAGDARPFVRFLRRLDSLLLNDTLRGYTIDSAEIQLSVLRRDTLQTGIALNLWVVPLALDSTASVGQLDAELLPERLMATIEVPDTLESGRLRHMLQRADLERLGLLADSGVFNLVVTVTSPQPTGLLLGSANSGSLLPILQNFITVDIADENLQQRTLNQAPLYAWHFVDPADRPPSATELVVGGAPSARGIIRFALPPRLRDSVSIIRATLELIPFEPILGIPGEQSGINVVGVLTDLGLKSPLVPLDPGTVTIDAGFADTVRVEVAQFVRLWQGESGLANALFVAQSPEGSTFMRPVFGTSRSDRPPRLRITYVRPFDFETP